MSEPVEPVPIRLSISLSTEENGLLMALKARLEARAGRVLSIAETIRHALRQSAAHEGINE